MEDSTLKDSDIESFLSEGVMMKDFKHENVLGLIGVTMWSDDKPMIILPYMDNGDLLSYISNKKNVRTKPIMY